MSMREKTQADFDLERITQLFDQALTSKDERVVNALRSLLMVVALTDPETSNQDLRQGPFRQLQEELKQLRNQIISLEMQVSQLRNPPERAPYGGGPGNPYGPYVNPGSPYGPTWTGTSTDPNTPWTTSYGIQPLQVKEIK